MSFFCKLVTDEKMIMILLSDYACLVEWCL